jgi:hypothetical protein
MKKSLLLAAGLTLLPGFSAWAQTDEAADARPSALNIAGQQFPKVDSQARAIFRSVVVPELKTEL